MGSQAGKQYIPRSVGWMTNGAGLQKADFDSGCFLIKGLLLSDSLLTGSSFLCLAAEKTPTSLVTHLACLDHNNKNVNKITCLSLPTYFILFVVFKLLLCVQLSGYGSPAPAGYHGILDVSKRLQRKRILNCYPLVLAPPTHSKYYLLTCTFIFM